MSASQAFMSLHRVGRTRVKLNEYDELGPLERKPIRTNSHQNEYVKYCALLWLCVRRDIRFQPLNNARLVL